MIQLVEELSGNMTIGEVCGYLGVSRSSYYCWKAQEKNETPKEIRDLQIGELCKAHKFRYGYRKIAELYSGASEKMVQHVMQKHGGSAL